MTKTPQAPQSWLMAVISLSLVMLAAYVASTYYQAQLEQEEFSQRIQGMGEYELCQLSANEFGMKMVEDMGCLAGNYVL